MDDSFNDDLLGILIVIIRKVKLMWCFRYICIGFRFGCYVSRIDGGGRLFILKWN